MTYNLLAIVESIFAGWILTVRFETSYGFLKRQRFFGFSLLDRITGALYKIKKETKISPTVFGSNKLVQLCIYLRFSGRSCKHLTEIVLKT